MWLYSAAGVRAAAQHLDPLHRLLAVAVNGEESVRALETADPQSVARAGLAALHALSLQAHGQEFLQLTALQQIDLLTSAGTAQPGNPLRKFFEITRAQADPRLLHLGRGPGGTRLQRQRLLRRQPGLRSEILSARPRMRSLDQRIVPRLLRPRIL